MRAPFSARQVPRPCVQRPLPLLRGRRQAGLQCVAHASTAGVRISVQGKHLEVTDAIDAYAKKKLAHSIDPYKVVVNDVDVRLSARGGDASRGGKEQKIEVTIRTARHGVIRAEEVQPDLYASIDLASDKIHRALRKLKEKSIKKGSWPGRGFSRGAEKISDRLGEDLSVYRSIDVGDDLPGDDEVSDALASLDLPSTVKRTKVIYLDSMSLKDAIDNLGFVDHDFYVYLDRDSGNVQVVYKRDHDDGHGVIIAIPASDQ